MKLTIETFQKILNRLNAVGVALSAQQNRQQLLELILDHAKDMANADGGTLYMSTEENTLKFVIMRTDSLGIHMGGKKGDQVAFDDVQLLDEHGDENTHNVAACAANKKRTFNIQDAYTNTDFDFSGTRQFDKKTGYRSQSFLTVPMINHEHKIVGVLQLINALDPAAKAVRAFSDLEQQIVESLASQAAMAITNGQLIEAQKKLFDALTRLIAQAIDEKSPHTAGHCRRVPVITKMIAEAVCAIDYGPLKDFSMTEAEIYELKVAAWLHDCGKITTPEAVVEKSSKLETIFDRIGLVDTRFEVLKRDAEIAALKRKLATLDSVDIDGDKELSTTLKQLDDDRKFIRQCNIGGETMDEKLQQRVRDIATYQWCDADGKVKDFLSADEVHNLNIYRGTLTPEERQIINNHIVLTIRMLESLPYPDYLKNIPEYAGGHHEKMDGTGYPRGLTRYEMSIPARMMGIADIFEALTASDRPYKKGMPISQTLSILGRMREEHAIDPDLFDVFMWQKVYERYAGEFLPAGQLDKFDLQTIPGYAPPTEHA